MTERHQIAITCQTIPAVVWETVPSTPSCSSLTIYRIQISVIDLPSLKRQALLRPGEVLRAERYHQQKDQDRFIIARSSLRGLLSRYTGQLPTAIQFEEGTNKKPVVQGFSNIHYNVSHSGNCILIGIGPEPVGVDVEYINPKFNFRDLLPYSFGAEERQFMAENSAAPKDFYRCWTRKEALIKATAKGIDDGFSQIPSLDGVHAIAAGVIGSMANWAVSSFMVADEYMGAVAFPSQQVQLPITFCEVDQRLFGTSY